MSTPSSSELLRSLAQHLADEGVALYAPTYPSVPTLPAVFFGALPQAPILAVALARYDTNSVTDPYNPFVRVQLRWRAPKALAVEDLADAAFQVLHFFERTDPPRDYPNGVRVQHCRRVVTTEAEKDSSSTNWERADSYEFTLNP